MWRRLNPSSMLLGEPDRSLIRLDRRLRRAVNGASRDDLERVAAAPGSTAPGGSSLALIYAAVAAWYRREWDAAMADLRTAIGATEIPFLRARAIQILVYLLFMSADEERDSDKPSLAEAHEKECRELCERAFKEFAGFAWSAPVFAVLETALGVLDYPQERFTSRLHLSKALKADSQAHRDMAVFCPGCLGFAYLFSGHHSLHEGDAATAARHYEDAARELSGDLRMHATVFQMEAISRTGDFARLKRVAARAMRHIPAGARDGPHAIEAKRFLAQAYIRSGDLEKGGRMLQEVAAAPGDQSWKPAARRWLDEWQAARSRRP